MLKESMRERIDATANGVKLYKAWYELTELASSLSRSSASSFLRRCTTDCGSKRRRAAGLGCVRLGSWPRIQAARAGWGRVVEEPPPVSVCLGLTARLCRR